MRVTKGLEAVRKAERKMSYFLKELRQEGRKKLKVRKGKE